jgi:hypothetical protein
LEAVAKPSRGDLREVKMGYQLSRADILFLSSDPEAPYLGDMFMAMVYKT